MGLLWSGNRTPQPYPQQGEAVWYLTEAETAAVTCPEVVKGCYVDPEGPTLLDREEVDIEADPIMLAPGEDVLITIPNASEPCTLEIGGAWIYLPDPKAGTLWTSVRPGWHGIDLVAPAKYTSATKSIKVSA